MISSANTIAIFGINIIIIANVMEKDSVFTRIASEYNVSEVIYAHIHGKHRYNDSIIGKYRGRQYSLVSGDYLNWIPKKIMG